MCIEKRYLLNNISKRNTIENRKTTKYKQCIIKYNTSILSLTNIAHFGLFVSNFFLPSARDFIDRLIAIEPDNQAANLL